MTTDFFSLIGNYGAVGLLFAFFIWQYFRERSKADTLKSTEKVKKTDVDQVARELSQKQEIEICNLGTILQGHMKSNEESFGVIHNGLNTYNQTLKDMNVTLQNYRVMVEKLSVIIEERMPKRKE